MGLVELAKGFIEPKGRISPEAMRSSRPVKSHEVTEEELPDGSVVLRAPLAMVGARPTRWVNWAQIAKRMNAPDTKAFELEPVGAFVWALCDGNHTFDAISRKLREKYKMNRVEADAALRAFLQMLGQRRLITLMPGKSK